MSIVPERGKRRVGTDETSLAPRSTTGARAMTGWRPPARIRVVAIGLARRGDVLLVAHVTDDTGRAYGVRPFGGAVAFGETAEQALHREFAEELQATIDITGPPLVLENLFEHHGARGHEIVFAFPVHLIDPGLAVADRFVTADDGQPAVVGQWVDRETLASEALALFPDGLQVWDGAP